MTLSPVRGSPAHPLPRQALAFARPTARSLKVKAVGSFLPSLTAQAFKKFGFSTAQLIMDWPAIAGKDLAAHSLPERLKWPPRPEAEAEEGEPAQGRRGATLLLRVNGARALEIDYQRQQILERVNAYFGYRAVSELRLVQAPLPAAPTAPVRPPRAAACPPPCTEVVGIPDAALREALARLGSRLGARLAPR
ncbi:MAG TPA: DciA family protein [Hyphomicrobiaceae bacterium]|nr:DciA family protein [Hyphomicrobiaceae bacterium]